jgi:hypothetical protein
MLRTIINKSKVEKLSCYLESGEICLDKSLSYVIFTYTHDIHVYLKLVRYYSKIVLIIFSDISNWTDYHDFRSHLLSSDMAIILQ